MTHNSNLTNKKCLQYNHNSGITTHLFTLRHLYVTHALTWYKEFQCVYWNYVIICQWFFFVALILHIVRFECKTYKYFIGWYMLYHKQYILCELRWLIISRNKAKRKMKNICLKNICDMYENRSSKIIYC